MSTTDSLDPEARATFDRIQAEFDRRRARRSQYGRRAAWLFKSAPEKEETEKEEKETNHRDSRNSACQ